MLMSMKSYGHCDRVSIPISKGMRAAIKKMNDALEEGLSVTEMKVLKQ